MQRIAFPRLYVAPVESAELPPLPVQVTYHGRRSPFGPVTVHCVTQTHELVSERDWRGEEAVTLAGALLDHLDAGECDRECREAFAGEVLAELATDSWELTVQEIYDWYFRWRDGKEAARWQYPPEHDADEELPGSDDDARMLELVRKLGGSDDA